MCNVSNNLLFSKLVHQTHQKDLLKLKNKINFILATNQQNFIN